MTRKKLIIIGVLILLLVVVILVLLWRSRQQTFTYREPTVEELMKEERGYIKGEEQLRQFKAANPLVQYLPYRTQNFEVHYRVSGPTRMEAIYEVILRPQKKSSDAGYKEEISQLTAVVREWIKSKGIEPDSIPIEWTTATP